MSENTNFDDAEKIDRRELLAAAVGGGSLLLTALATGAGRAVAAEAEPMDLPNAEHDWRLMLDLTVRITPGALEQWSQHWKTVAVPALEEVGQWLWGGWSSLTGQQETITHQWAYRDLAHMQAMARIRSESPKIRGKLTGGGASILDNNLLTTALSALPYSPKSVQSRRPGSDSVIVAARTFSEGVTGSPSEYTKLMTDYVGRATSHGAQLAGAFESIFGWAPAYQLHVWRYPDMATYYNVRRAIETDAECQKLWAQLRTALGRPLTYSRI
jgi:hypothetical protein